MSLSFLNDLPSRGLLTAVQSGSAFVSAPAPYIADHNTAPPPDQVVKTDPTSLLIKSLQRKARGEPRKKAAPARPGAAADSGKRPADGPAEGDGGQAKRAGAAGPSGGAGAGPSSGAGPSGSGAGPSVLPPAQSAHTPARLRTKTVKDLQAVLKAWGLPVSGKKDDLVNRIMEKQEAAQGRR